MPAIDSCFRCGGTGKYDGAEPRPCSACGGEGYTEVADDEDEDDFYDYDDELDCTWCGGDGVQENDDPLWHGFDKDWIPCECCAGTGLRSHQTIF